MRKVKAGRVFVEEEIDQDGACTYFDRAAQGDPRLGGAGGVLFLKHNHFLKFKAGLGVGSKKYVELMALKLLFSLAIEKSVSKLIFGDYILEIKCNKEYNVRNYILQPLIDEIAVLSSTIINIFFFHVYRERITVADGLSKEGLQLDREQWIILEDLAGQCSEYVHDPF